MNLINILKFEHNANLITNVDSIISMLEKKT